MLKVKLLIIEHVPARVCRETGEHLFSADTVEQIQQLLLKKQKPTRVMQVPVFEFVKNTAYFLSPKSSPIQLKSVLRKDNRVPFTLIFLHCSVLIMELLFPVERSSFGSFMNGIILTIIYISQWHYS